MPAVANSSWVQSAVDGFLLAALEKQGLQPVAAADRRTLIRRATFDLIGLPPTPADVADFLADRSPHAFARVVDRLLASPHYGERWGRHWLDVVRYADARDLIQLPAESDFREAWRYRDWVVAAFNSDLSYREFVRNQIAGDLLPPARPGGINKDGLVATGLLAIADFVPGDVDKEQMIADYVNDQVDVVSRAFLGLSVACARCHDHKFDPISIEDYYALAGIFFSTRLVPGPIPGNTPLVRVALLSDDELASVHARERPTKGGGAQLEQQLPDAADRTYVAFLRQLVVENLASYLVTASEYRQTHARASEAPACGDGATERAPRGFAGGVCRLPRQGGRPGVDRPACDRSRRGGRRDRRPEARHGRGRAAARSRRSGEPERARVGMFAAGNAVARSHVIELRADDPYLDVDAAGRVVLWPNRSGLPADARPLDEGRGPVKTNAVINGRARPVLRFEGEALLELPRQVPTNGTLVVVCRTAPTGSPSQRLLGWEDSDAGKHGLGLMFEPDGKLHAILRNNGQSGDLVDAECMARGFETICVSWGSRGTTLHRNGAAAGSQKGVDEVSRDPAIAALRLGGPGSGNSPRYQGDVAEVRVYDRQLDERERLQVEGELRASWFDPVEARPPSREPLKELYEELLSARGPFWVAADTRRAMLPAPERSRLDALFRELENLKKQPAARDSPRGRRAGWRAQGDAPRGIQGLPRLSPRQSPSVGKARGPRCSARSCRRWCVARCVSVRGVAGVNSRNGSRVRPIP